MIEKEIKISEIEALLNEYDVEVESPDGFVKVSRFLNKGEFDEYVISDMFGNSVRVNANHLFETDNGWVMAEHFKFGMKVLKDDGHYHHCIVVKTGDKIPIVDIVVEHSNHRYYTNGFSSHNTNVGKSLMMCHFSAGYLQAGKNVLYITLEMAEEAIANRIDANLFDVDINDVQKLDKSVFTNNINRIKQKTMGNLVIKEYPTSSIHVGHIRTLLQELRSKSNFVPDVIMVDYINIMSSSRVKMSSTSSYFYIKAVAEELRGLAVEFEVPLWSATQTNRSGANDMDVDLTSTAESFGLPATADFMFAAIRSEELDKLGQILVKQLKSRYANKSDIEKFVVGINPARAKLYDVEYSAQEGLIQSSGETIDLNSFKSPATNKKDFSNIQI